MIISVDLTSLPSTKTGTVTYCVEILSNLINSKKNDYFVLFVTKKALCHFQQFSNKINCRFEFLPSNRYLRFIFQQLYLPLKINFTDVDCHWGPTFILPLLCIKPMILTIHDMTFNTHSKYHEKIKSIFFSRLIKLFISRAKLILVNSNTTYKDLRKIINIEKKNIKITPLAPREYLSFNKPSKDLKKFWVKKYFLFIGTIEPRKNLIRLIEAWSKINSQNQKNFNLLIVGKRGWNYSQFFNILKEKQGIYYLGSLSDDDLFYILQKSYCFIYPSLYEGFGLPVLEAMSQKIPVITSNIGATKEISGDSAILINPNNVNDITKSIDLIINNKKTRNYYAQKGYINSKKYTWKKTTDLTYKEILSIL